MSIAIFYHCLFYLGDPPDLSEMATGIVYDQMRELQETGLQQAASAIFIGVNGGEESRTVARTLVPYRAKVVYHGLQCKSENRTILMIEEWVKHHPNWHVLYFHAKGATKTEPKAIQHAEQWRNCMMHHLIRNWSRCNMDLRYYDSVGCHWMAKQGSDHSQNYWGGNFWWATSNFLRTLPSITQRHQIKTHGLDSIESRYEAEVWIGNGPRLPRVRDFHPAHPGIRGACSRQPCMRQNESGTYGSL